MGTTDNFDSANATLAVSTSTLPVLLTSGAGARNHTLDAVTPFTGRFRFPTAVGNLGTLSSLGTNSATVAGTVLYADIFIPVVGRVLTGISVLNGATVGTDKGIVSLYDSAGNLLANSALAGATTSGASTFQAYNFTATYAILKPGKYFIGYQSNGTTDTVRTIATATWIDVATGSTTGAFGTLPAITPPTTFTADKGPFAFAF